MGLPSIWMADTSGYNVELARIQGCEAARTGLTENPWPADTLEAHMWELCRQAVIEMGGEVEYGWFADESNTRHFYSGRLVGIH